MKAMNHSERLRRIVEDGKLDHSPLAMADVLNAADRIDWLEDITNDLGPAAIEIPNLSNAYHMHSRGES